MKSSFELNGGIYSAVGDYLLPNLSVPDEPPVVLGKYALLRKQYLKQHRRILYVNLLTSGKINEHLMDVERAAIARFDLLVQQMAATQGITEHMKTENQMAWVGQINNVRACVDEIIRNEIIYT